MSNQTQVHKHAVKGKGLGRGLGSLLGGEEGAFSKTTPPAELSLKALSENLPSHSQPAMRAGFIETQPARIEPTQALATPVVDLAPVAAPIVPAHLRIWQIPIEKIDPNPLQPRQIFAKEALQDLANSIQEKGIIQPLLVRKKGDGQFEIIAGERRWRAAQLAGLKDVPAILKDSEDQEVLELALIENIQRENLNVIEEAEAYDFLVSKYNLTQQQLAQKVGKDRATVANLLRLLQLEPSVRQMVSKGQLSLGQAKILLSVADVELQEILAKRAHSESLSVRALEKLVSRSKTPEPVEKIPVNASAELKSSLAAHLGEELQKLIGSKVVLDYSDGKGKIAIHFYSDDELNQVAEKLRKSWQR